MKKEIGSEFWNAPTSIPNSIFPEYTQWFLSGRSALQAIIKDLTGCKTVAIPSWCCESMIKPFIDANIEVYFYPVYYENNLVQEISLESDVILIMDYFGYTSSSIVPSNRIVIRDVTHSIFSENDYVADYYFGSLRKWCGVWTGGYAWTKNGQALSVSNYDDCGYTDLRKKAMHLKNLYINNVENIDRKLETNKEYLAIYEKAEQVLEDTGIISADTRDIYVAKHLDANFIKSRRRANADVLRSEFHDWLIFKEMKDTDCPMFVPVMVPYGFRNKLRKYLIENNIYCPIHWPLSKYHKLNKKEEFIYNNEISLVCDQRYTKEDMYRIVETIKKFWKGV